MPGEASALACPLCQSGHSEVLTRKNGYDIWRCRQDGLVFTVPAPSVAQAASLYSQEYFEGGSPIGYAGYAADSKALLANACARLREIERLRGRNQPGRLLDVGCAYGYFLKAAIARGWEAQGLELSEHAAGRARQAGLRVTLGDLGSANLPEAKFDVVTMWDTLEHMPDPFEALRRARTLLRPGGLLAIGTDDAGSTLARLMGPRWYGIAPPWHIRVFSRAALRAALRQADFEVLTIGARGKYWSLGAISARLNTFYPSGMTRWLRRLSGNTLRRLTLYLNRGDWMCAYARRPL